MDREMVADGIFITPLILSLRKVSSAQATGTNTPAKVKAEIRKSQFFPQMVDPMAGDEISVSNLSGSSEKRKIPFKSPYSEYDSYPAETYSASCISEGDPELSHTFKLKEIVGLNIRLPLRKRSSFKRKVAGLKSTYSKEDEDPRTPHDLLAEEYKILDNLHLDWMIYSPEEGMTFSTPTQRKGTDKTLILNLNTFLYFPFDPKFKVDEFFHGSLTPQSKISYILRPYFMKFLSINSLMFEIIVFTEYDAELAIELLSEICDDPNLVDYVVCREHCSLLGDLTIKETKVFKDRKDEKLIILDHKISSWPFNQAQIVPILPFLGDVNDTELFSITKHLRLKAAQN